MPDGASSFKVFNDLLMRP